MPKSRVVSIRSMPFCVVALFAAVLTFDSSLVSAATVALSGLHMARVAGANRPATQRFTSGTKTVYFDYSVVTESSDTGSVEVLDGGPKGKVVSSAPLFFGTSNSLYVSLKSATKSAWPTGSYCTILLVDGARSTMEGQAPVAWSVGSANPPACRDGQATPLYLSESGTLRAKHTGTVTVTVRGPDVPVAGATVTLKGSSVGLAKTLHGRTNVQGVYRFKKVLPHKSGTIVITASKSKFAPAKEDIKVRK